MWSDWKTLRELIETRGIHGTVIVSAEVGLNHNGDPDLAKKCIEVAAECGCQAVKFQNYRTGDVVKSRTETIMVDGIYWNAWDLFSRCELDFETLRMLKEHSEKCGMVFHSTPTGESGIRDVLDLNVRLVKLASDVLLVNDVRRYAWRKVGNVLASLGCVPDSYLLQAKPADYISQVDSWVWLHCVRQYPTPTDHADLPRIRVLRRLLNPTVLIGYSDHTEGIDCAVSAVKDYGACWLECHFTLDHALPGPDHRWSKDPCQMKELVRSLQ